MLNQAVNLTSSTPRSIPVFSPSPSQKLNTGDSHADNGRFYDFRHSKTRAGAKSKSKLKPLAARRDSFSLDTVAQSPISSVSLSVFLRYLDQQTRALETLSAHRQLKTLITRQLRKFGFVEHAEKLEKCSANFTALVCENGHSFRAIPDARCGLSICPDCCRVKANREMRRIAPKIHQALKDSPSLIVAFNSLTLRSDKARSLRNGCREIKSSFARLRARDVWASCVGGVGRVENTASKKLGWHPHLHSVVLLQNYIPQKDLSAGWCQLTKGSMVVDIRTVHDVSVGLVECIKYPFKPADILKLNKAQIQEMLDLKGERLGVSFGVLRGIEVDADIEDGIKDEFSEFTQQTKTLEVGDACPICRTRLDLVDFTTQSYAGFLSLLPARGS